MRTLCTTIEKGGSGKTTITTNLAAGLAVIHDQRVLVIDLDRQAQATRWLAAHSEENDSLYRYFQAKAKSRQSPMKFSDLIVHDTSVPGVSVVPGHKHLKSLPDELSSVRGKELILARAFAELPPDSFDFIICDTPAAGVLVDNALAACQELIIPVDCTGQGEEGIAELLDTIEEIRQDFNPALEVSAVVPFCYDGRTNLSEGVVANLRSVFGSALIKARINVNIPTAESYSESQCIFEYRPKSRGAEDFAALAKQVMKLRSDTNGRKQETQTSSKQSSVTEGRPEIRAGLGKAVAANC